MIEALTESSNPRRYWSDLKIKLTNEGSELYEKIVQLKMKSSDGKFYKTDVLDTKGILRLVQSVPSHKAEPFKLWLAQVGSDRIDETFDPSKAIDRAISIYRAQGHDKIKFIDNNKEDYDVRLLCKCLNIHHSVYYYHCNHRENSYKKANQELDIKIQKIYDESKGRYGSPKITKILNSCGKNVSQKRVARRMKSLGLKSIIIKKFNHSSSSKTVDTKEYPNLLEQKFYAEKPNEKWVGDITYIYTKETGWTYLAIVMDLFDLKIVGWTYGLNMTDDLVITAFNKALINRGLNKDGIFHSDRGSQYTSNDYEKLLQNLNIKHSYSKKGYPYDNASMESFNAILKKEEVNVNSYKTFNEARLAIFEFIESWYNNKRIHSTLGYITPNEKYNAYTKSLALT